MGQYTIHEPGYDGTTRDGWSPPEWEAFDTDDLGKIDDHFLASASGFAPEAFEDLALAVVSPDGDLHLAALETVHECVEEDDEFGDETVRDARTLARRLADEQFDQSLG